MLEIRYMPTCLAISSAGLFTEVMNPANVFHKYFLQIFIMVYVPYFVQPHAVCFLHFDTLENKCYCYREDSLYFMTKDANEFTI